VVLEETPEKKKYGEEGKPEHHRMTGRQKYGKDYHITDDHQQCITVQDSIEIEPELGEIAGEIP
jgi:hypothetical protein